MMPRSYFRPAAVAPLDSAERAVVEFPEQQGAFTAELEPASCRACQRGAAFASFGSDGGTLALALAEHGCFTCPRFLDELLLSRDLCGGPSGLSRRWRSSGPRLTLSDDISPDTKSRMLRRVRRRKRGLHTTLPVGDCAMCSR